jgi:hypothetical protein
LVNQLTIKYNRMPLGRIEKANRETTAA